MLPEGRTQPGGRPDRRYDFPAVGGASRRHEQRLGADGQGDSRTAVETLLFDVYKASRSWRMFRTGRHKISATAVFRGLITPDYRWRNGPWVW